MRTLLAIYCLISLTACSTIAPPNSQWNNIVYEGLDQELESLELPETIDCGFFSLTSLKPKQRNQVVGRQFDCAQRAMTMGKSFKFGHTWIPVDSRLTEIVISQREQFLVKRIDVMPDGSSTQQQTMLCKQIQFNRKAMVIEQEDCAGDDM